MTLKVAAIGVRAMRYNHVRVYSEVPDVELVSVVDESDTLMQLLNMAA